MLDVVVLLLTALAGLVLSYFIVTVFNIGSESDPALSRDLQQLTMQTATLGLNTVLLPAKGLWSIGTDMTAMLVGRGKWTVALAGLTALTFLMHYYHSDVLSILDDGWTCSVVPILKNIVTPFLQMTRVMYALAAPLANAFLVIHGQIAKAWYITLATCSHINLFVFFREIAMALITFFQSMGRWFGAGQGTPLNADNNLIVNDFEIEIPVNHTLAAVTVAQEVLGCACNRFKPLFNIVFFAAECEHVTKAVDNLFQTGIRAAQMILRLLYKEFPNVYAVSFKLERALVETGLALDAIAFNTLRSMIVQFDPAFKLQAYPREAFFTAAMRTAAAGVHIGATVGVNGPLHMMALFDPSRSAFDPSVWSLERSLSQLHLASAAAGALAQWLVYVIERIVTDTENIAAVFTDADTPIRVECDWSRDVRDHRLVSLSYTSGCSIYYAGIVSANTAYIAYGLVVELLTKSVFTQEQNIFRTMQRWEGPSLPREKVYTCEERRAATAYDYLDQEYYNEGWIWTQDRGQCSCETHYGYTPEEGERLYSPWCGQPTLNFDVFAPMDALVMHVSHGLLGPGFGDAIPYMSRISEIKIDLGFSGTSKSIPLPMTLPPLTRSVIETARVVTRVVLSFGDIVTGHFFNYPVNCGHGMNHTQLSVKWTALTGTSTRGKSESELRWSACEARRYSALSDDVKTPRCDTNNDSPECMCSYTQPLTLDSQCQCIARYPDLDMTAASQTVGDLIEDRFTSEDVAHHWCNSMLIEWTFQNTAKFADALDYIVSLAPINPTCDVIDRLTKGEGFDTDSEDARSKASYLIAETPTMNFTAEFMGVDSLVGGTSEGSCTIREGRWEDALDEAGAVVYEDGEAKQVWIEPEWSCDASERYTNLEIDSDIVGCQIWGREDFFCSAGLLVRNTKRLSMNIARQAVNDGIAIMAGNFADLNVNPLPRLCDFERIFGATASMIAGIIPRIPPALKHAFAKYIMMLFQFMYVHVVRIGLVLNNIGTTLVMDVVKGQISQSSMELTFQKGVDTVVDSYLWFMRFFWETTGDLLDAISPGAGEICHTVVKMVDAVAVNLKEGLMEVVGLVLQMVVQFWMVLTGDIDLLDDFFTNYYTFQAKVLTIIASQLVNILHDFFEQMGAVGVFFTTLIKTVCPVLNSVFDIIDGVMKTFGSETGWVKLSCPKFEHAHVDTTRARLQQHGLGAENDRHLPRRVAEALDWSGRSTCDLFMEASGDYTYSDLRPLERAQWHECLELKLIGVELAGMIGVKSFPTDIAYNWKRKYMLAYDFLRAGIVVARTYVDNGKLDWGSIRMTMYDQGLDAELHMRLFQMLMTGATVVTHQLESSSLTKDLLRHFDGNFEQAGNPSMAARTWRTYNHVSGALSTAKEHWSSASMSSQWWKAVDAAHEAHPHVVRWWSALGTEVSPSQTHTEQVIGHLRQRLERHWGEKIKPTKKPSTRRLHWLRAPLRTGVENCTQRGSPAWCTDCAILDNLIATVVQQGDAIGHFYSNRFPVLLENVSGYFDELGDYNGEFFDGVYARLSKEHGAAPKGGRRWTYHVARDWSHFFGNMSMFLVKPWDAERKASWLEQVDLFLAAGHAFVKTTGDAYVPFFGYSFQHMYNYVLFSACDMDAAVFVTTSTEAQRVARMDSAFLACLAIALVIVFNTAWSVIPLVWLANTIVMGAILAFVYLYMVYGYMLTCAPLLPYTLVEDFNAWYHTRLDPGCFYKQLPYMAVQNETMEELCLTCTAPQEYLDCAAYDTVPVSGMLPLSEVIETFSIFWPVLFWTRWRVPAVFTPLVQWGLVGLDTTLGKLAMAAWQDEPVDGVWIDCYHAMWLDNVLAGLIGAFVSYVTIRVTIVTVQTVLQAVLVVWHLYTLLSYVSLAVEQTAVTSI